MKIRTFFVLGHFPPHIPPNDSSRCQLNVTAHGLPVIALLIVHGGCVQSWKNADIIFNGGAHYLGKNSKKNYTSAAVHENVAVYTSL